MSSTNIPSTPSTAPWRPIFLNHISKMSSPEFVLSSLQVNPDASSPTPYIPRARYCIYRGLWAELPASSYNKAPKNDHVYESDLPIFTTDVRMSKVEDIFPSSAGNGDLSQRRGSGGGGPIEAVFWIPEVMTQWRVRGSAYIVGPDIEGEGADGSGPRTVKEKISQRMRVVKEEGKEGWSWKREVTAIFGNLSPGMRGSFKSPFPGSPINVPTAEEGVGQGQDVENLEDEVARRNFRVVIILPEEVEQLDLSVPYQGKKWKYTYVGNGEVAGEGAWKKQELWP